MTYGLVGRWKLDEGEGSIAYDISGNDNYGVLYGPTWVKGLLDRNCLYFDGADDYVNVTNTHTFDNISMMYWIKTPPNLGTDPNTGYGEIGGEYNSIRLSLLKIYGTDYIRIHLSTDGETGTEYNINYEIPGDLSTNTWYHMACTYDGTTYKLYFNKELVKTEVYDAFYNGINQFRFGANTFGGYSEGTYSDISIYDIPVSQKQIEDNYNEGLYYGYNGYNRMKRLLPDPPYDRSVDSNNSKFLQLTGHQIDEIKYINSLLEDQSIISSARLGSLDMLGDGLGLKRKLNETDNDYRSRLLITYFSLSGTKNNMIQAIKSYANLTTNPTILEAWNQDGWFINESKINEDTVFLSASDTLADYEFSVQVKSGEGDKTTTQIKDFVDARKPIRTTCKSVTLI